MQESRVLRARTLPILAGETVQGELLDAQPGALFGHAADATPRRGGAPRSAATRWRCAQRPLPSMIMAMCRGSLSRGTSGKSFVALVISVTV